MKLIITPTITKLRAILAILIIVGTSLIVQAAAGFVDSYYLAKELSPMASTANEQFGRAVMIEGETLAISAKIDPSDELGSVFIFEPEDVCPFGWQEIIEISAPDAPANDDSFGSYMAMSGDTLAVGAPKYYGGASNTGSVFIYERDLGGTDNWGLSKVISDSLRQSDDRFGAGIALKGNRLAIGAPKDDDLGSNTGSVFIYERNQGGADNWGLVNKIFGSGISSDERFGQDIA